MKKFKKISRLLQSSHIEALKNKDCTARSKLYPLERNIACGGCRNGRCQFCKNVKVTDTFDSFTTKQVTKSTINLAATISA